MCFTHYVILLQAVLIACKLFELTDMSWWLVFIPFVAANIIMFSYNFCIAFKREYTKAKNIKSD